MNIKNPLKSKLFIFLLIFLLIYSPLTIILGKLYLDNEYTEHKRDYVNKGVISKIFKVPNAPKKAIVDSKEITQSAWVPEWGNQRGFDSVVRNKDKFNDINPVMYNVNNDGTLKNIRKEGSERLLQFLRGNGTLIIPSIQIFDAEILKSVLNNKDYYNNHISGILNEVDKYKYDGIDIDYESTYLDDKALFFSFLTDLSAEFKKRDKHLVATLLPKWGDNINYTAFPQTRKVQDYERIGKIVDEVRIMLYDYTYQASKYPGAIAPKEWVEDVAAYTATKIDPHKVVLAGRLYAYDWIYDEKTFLPVRPLEDLVSSNVRAKAYTYEDVVAIKNKYPNGKDEYNEKVGENIFIYNDGTNDRVIFYPDTKSIDLLKEITKKHGFKGVAYWRLGGDKGLNF